MVLQRGSLPPNFDKVIASSTDESFDRSRARTRRRIKGRARANSRSPANSIATNLHFKKAS